MRILVLARHVAETDRVLQAATGVAALGHEVLLLACAREGEPPHQRDGSLLVERVVEPPPMIPRWDEVSGSLQDAMVLFEHGIAALLEQPADVLLAVGWPVAWAAVGLHRSFEVPLVALLEPRRIARRRRRWGRGDELIEETERWLASEATRVVVRSAVAREILVEQLATPADHVRVIAGGGAERLAAVCSEAAEAPITIGEARRARAMKGAG